MSWVILKRHTKVLQKNARINDVNLDYGASMSLSELKEANKTMLSNFDLISVTETGYPDLLDYEGDGMVVISWWDLKFKNISSGKEFLVDLHMQHSSMMMEKLFVRTTTIMVNYLNDVISSE